MDIAVPVVGICGFMLIYLLALTDRVTKMVNPSFHIEHKVYWYMAAFVWSV